MKTSKYFIGMGLLVLALIFVAGTSRALNLGNNFLAAVLSSSTSTTGEFTLSPSSMSLDVAEDKVKFSNSVSVSFPYIPGTLWPAWYITNTASWNTINYHYGKALPNGWGPGKIEWETDLTGYATGTYTDTITLRSEGYGSVTFTQTVRVLPNGTPIVTPPVVTNPVESPAPTIPTGPISSTPPVPRFVASCVSLTCTFDASTSLGTITSYEWDFGKSSNGTGTGRQVSVTYPHEGSRTVTLTVFNNGSSASASKTFSVVASVSTPAPAPAPTPIPTPSTKFSVGAAIQTTATLNVRATASPNGNLLGTQSSGVQGTITAGPTNSGNYNWWQVNYATGVDGWSVEDFLTSASSVVTPIPIIPPPAPVQTPVPDLNNLPAHPRVWMDPARVTQLRAQVSANTIRWQRVKSAADGQVSRGVSYAVSDEDKIPDLCLAYLGTGDVRYAQRAGSILSAYAVEANTLVGDSGYGVRFMLPLVTMGLDWCYNGLTSAQRQQAATWLMNRADWVWPETNSGRSTGYGVSDPNNNYWWGFMMTGPAALAAAGNDTGSGAVSGSNRASYHRQLALTKWTNIALPFFLTKVKGGAWAEGTNYESTWRAGSFADAFLTSGTPLTTPFLEQSLKWRIHSTMPGNMYKIPFGDQPRSSDAILFTYDRMSALYAMPPSNAPSLLVSQIYKWLNLIGQVPQSEFSATASLADELLRFDTSKTPATDFSVLPKDYYAEGPGFFVYRSSWTDPNATIMAFESGPNSDHGARDANGLMIWKGSFWISSTANIFSYSGIEGATKNYNNLTVGGVGQYLYAGNGGTIIAQPQVSDTLIAVRGQAKNAYGYQNEWANTRFVSDYLRTVAYVPQKDTFVIVDRATAIDSSKTKVWRWHSKNPAVISGNRFTLANPLGDHRCIGSVLLPSDAVLGSEAILLGSAGVTTSNAVTVTLPPGRASDVVVTVLQCTSAQSAPYSVSASSNGTNITTTIGNSQVTIPLNENQPVTIQ